MEEENSIQSALENRYGRATAALIQHLRTDLNEDKILILVEGDDDKEFYKRFFRDDIGVVRPMAGCDILRKSVSDINNFEDGGFHDRIFGIVDSDYFAIDGIPESSDNIFRTDWHDHETWLVNVDRILSSVLAGYVGDEVDAEDFMGDVYRGIQNLSYIKWFHTRQKRVESLKPEEDRKEGYDFGKSAMEAYFGKSIGESLEYLISQQENIEKKTPIEEIEVTAFKNDYKEADRLHLHVGHDVMNGISYSIKNIKRQNIKKKEIYVKMSDQYTLEDFMQTTTYAEITEYLRSIGKSDCMKFSENTAQRN